jgi:hypothetical protein
MDMFTQWCPPQKKEGMVTSQGGMSEAFSAIVQMATEKRRFKKAPPQNKRHVATFPVAHALEMHFLEA